MVCLWLRYLNLTLSADWGESYLAHLISWIVSKEANLFDIFRQEFIGRLLNYIYWFWQYIWKIRYSFLVSLSDFLGRGYAIVCSIYCIYGPHGLTAASFTWVSFLLRALPLSTAYHYHTNGIRVCAEKLCRNNLLFWVSIDLK